MIPNPLAKRSAPESLTFTVTRRLLTVLAVLLAAWGVPGALASLTKPPPRAAPAPYAMDVPPLDWTTDGASLAPPVIQALFTGTLPPADSRQRRAPCDGEAEAEINGVCWVALEAKPPKCPKGRAWSHTDGKCYAPVLRAAPIPTTGQPMPVSVAGEAE